MREILFRGKRIDNGEWVLSHNIMVFKDGECQRTFMAGETENPIQVNVSPNGNLGLLNALECGLPLIDNSTIGQYTGLTDKNGKNIFEGDILYSDICKSKVVVYDEESAAFCLYDKSIVSPQYLGRYNTEYFEIIGNIHDNPEMLKGANNHDD